MTATEDSDILSEMAKEAVHRIAEYWFELLVKIGVVERFPDPQTGESRYKKLRDITATEEADLGGALADALARL